MKSGSKISVDVSIMKWLTAPILIAPMTAPETTFLCAWPNPTENCKRHKNRMPAQLDFFFKLWKVCAGFIKDLEGEFCWMGNIFLSFNLFGQSCRARNLIPTLNLINYSTISDKTGGNTVLCISSYTPEPQSMFTERLTKVCNDV